MAKLAVERKLSLMIVLNEMEAKSCSRFTLCQATTLYLNTSYVIHNKRWQFILTDPNGFSSRANGCRVFANGYADPSNGLM